MGLLREAHRELVSFCAMHMRNFMRSHVVWAHILRSCVTMKNAIPGRVLRKVRFIVTSKSLEMSESARYMGESILVVPLTKQGSEALC